MKNRISDVLIELATDPRKREDFERDADAFLSRYPLSNEEKDLLKSRDAAAIRLATFRREAGELSVVGTGIRLATQITPEAENCIRSADRVLHACAEGSAAQWIESLNPKSESLDLLIRYDQPRMVTYRATVDRILACVRHGLRVCVVFYGHPGVFANATHEAIRLARGEGYPAEMLPAISAEDCLFADLGLDPGASGYQSFEATDFLIHRKRIGAHNTVVLWQIGMIGESGYKASPNRTGLAVLTEQLLRLYTNDHPVIVYEASQYPVTAPVIRTISLAQLPDAKISAYSTLCIPPLKTPRPDLQIRKRLGFENGN